MSIPESGAGSLTKSTDFLWYVSPHQSIFSYQRAKLPKFFYPTLKINNALQHKHKTGSTETLLKYVGAVTNILEKSFCSCKSFDKSLNLLERPVKKCVKYYGCLETNLWNDIQHNETMNANELPFNNKYKDHFYYPSLEQYFIRKFLGDYFWYVK